MTTPTQDRDITATLSAPREEPTAEALEAAAVRLLDNAAVKLWNGWRSDGWKVFRHRSGDWSFMVGCADSSTGLQARGLSGYRNPLAAAVGLLKRHPELWPAEPDETGPEPQPLTVAAREAMRLLTDANHGDDGTLHHRCHVCSEPWPCEVEQARCILADALDPNTEAAALVALDSLEASR